MFADNTQQELEDLPTTWGGYDKLALRAKYFHNLHQPIAAMSGKFHTMWASSVVSSTRTQSGMRRLP